jgi:ATP-dependent protease ClpP protease subunit
MHEIKIYGEIVPFEEQWIIDQGGFYNLTCLQNALKEAKGKDIKVRIRSFGGDVETGFTMYNELRRYAKDNKAKVTTLGEGQVASIATVIFLAGDERILTGHTEPFVHNAWTYSEGDSKTLVRVAAELEKCNNMIADHYALHTDLTRDEALELMNNDTSITAEEAVTIRFATSIEEVLRPVALKRFSTNTNKNKMSNKTKRLTFYAKKTLGMVSNKLVVTADGKDLDFYELEDDAVIKVGDKAYYDGMDADGSFIMPDGETYVFIAGELQEIQSEDETDANSAEDLAEAETTIVALTEKVNELINTVSELQASNSAKDVLIAGYKASSKPAPNASKPNPAPAVPAKEPSKASLAVANLNKNVIKK